MQRNLSLQSLPSSGTPLLSHPHGQQSGTPFRKLLAWEASCAIFLLCLAVAVTSPAQTFTTLYSFSGTDGNDVQGPLIQGTDGKLYGMTVFGGSKNIGTIFNITTVGALTSIGSFQGANGKNPFSPLIQGTDGNFYGTTNNGGTGLGTIFKMTPTGIITTLHVFNGTDGVNPQRGLVQGTDGNFYGSTVNGGTGFGGVIFKISPSGTFKVLHNFRGGDGASLYDIPIQASDGNFYGTTWQGGNNNAGTIFRMTPGGNLTTLYSFCPGGDPCVDGLNSTSGLIQGTDGDLYGLTGRGGDPSCSLNGYTGCGTAFKITLSGTFTVLHGFTVPDGIEPEDHLIQGTDGNFYGVSPFGGAEVACGSGCGTIFSMTPGGTVTTLYNFCSLTGCADGSTAVPTLMQDTDGTFYGATSLGGAGAAGTVYSLSMGLGPFVKTLPASGKVGMNVAILGNNLTGATSVTFNGSAAGFTVTSSSLIKTAVPAGATTGTLQVVTPSGTLSSNVQFVVRP